MNTLYRGWVPTVTGRLSFSHFGDCTLPRTRSLSRSDGKTRYLLVEQSRTTWDVMLPAWRALEAALRIRGRSHFLCIAETIDLGNDNQAALAGKIFIISNHGIWRKELRAKLKTLFARMNNYSTIEDGAPLKTFLSNDYEAFKSACATNCAFQGSFTLKRNGVVDFSINQSDPRAGDAPAFPLGHKQHAVVAQLYSFLRDVGHRHQHHAPSTDTIVDLHLIEQDNDVEWRLRTLYSIYRRIISFKRQTDIAVQIRCVGLLAYAKAFKRVWLEDRPIAETNEEIPVYYDDAMKESIQASELRMRYLSQQSADRWSIFRTVTISILGLILSFAGLIKLSTASNIATPPSPILVWAANALLADPLAVIGICGALVLFLVLAFSSHFRPNEWKFFRYIQALLQPYRRRTVFVIFSLTSLSMLTLALEFVGWLGAVGQLFRSLLVAITALFT